MLKKQQILHFQLRFNNKKFLSNKVMKSCSNKKRNNIYSEFKFQSTLRNYNRHGELPNKKFKCSQSTCQHCLRKKYQLSNKQRISKLAQSRKLFKTPLSKNQPNSIQNSYITQFKSQCQESQKLQLPQHLSRQQPQQPISNNFFQKKQHQDESSQKDDHQKINNQENCPQNQQCGQYEQSMHCHQWVEKQQKNQQEQVKVQKFEKINGEQQINAQEKQPQKNQLLQQQWIEPLSNNAKNQFQQIQLDKSEEEVIEKQSSHNNLQEKKIQYLPIDIQGGHLRISVGPSQCLLSIRIFSRRLKQIAELDQTVQSIIKQRPYLAEAKEQIRNTIEKYFQSI